MLRQNSFANTLTFLTINKEIPMIVQIIVDW